MLRSQRQCGNGLLLLVRLPSASAVGALLFLFGYFQGHRTQGQRGRFRVGQLENYYQQSVFGIPVCRASNRELKLKLYIDNRNSPAYIAYLFLCFSLSTDEFDSLPGFWTGYMLLMAI